MRYRRASIAGFTYFFTVNLADQKSHLLVEQIDLLRNVIRRVRQSHSFAIVASHQSGQAWLCEARSELAVFVESSRYCEGKSEQGFGLFERGRRG